MTLELSREDRAKAIASIERYFAENLDERIGNVAAGALLGFFLDRPGGLQPRTVADVQERLLARVSELDLAARGGVRVLEAPREARTRPVRPLRR
jgi:uncharacterized protein (DUF2164 family)